MWTEVEVDQYMDDNNLNFEQYPSLNFHADEDYGGLTIHFNAEVVRVTKSGRQEKSCEVMTVYAGFVEQEGQDAAPVFIAHFAGIPREKEQPPGELVWRKHSHLLPELTKRSALLSSQAVMTPYQFDSLCRQDNPMLINLDDGNDTDERATSYDVLFLLDRPERCFIFSQRYRRGGSERLHDLLDQPSYTDSFQANQPLLCVKPNNKLAFLLFNCSPDLDEKTIADLTISDVQLPPLLTSAYDLSSPLSAFIEFDFVSFTEPDELYKRWPCNAVAWLKDAQPSNGSQVETEELSDSVSEL